MIRLLLTICVFLTVAASARAADENVIRIIRDDGSVVTIEMGDDGASTATVEGGESAPAAETPEAAPEEEVKDEPESEPSYPRRSKPVVTEVAPEAPPAAPAPKKKAAPKKVKPPKPAPEREISEGTPITQDLATQIALDNAPPSSRFNVYRTALEGVQVYLVLFQTADGPYEVVVDALDGKVLSRQSVRVETVQTPPGHLPPIAPAPVPPPVSSEGE
jgi:hypothetical protein